MKKTKKSRILRFFASDSNGKGDLSHIDFSADLAELEMGRKESGLFLNRFSEKSIRTIMDQVGLTDFLRAKGFATLVFVIDRDENLIHQLKIYNHVIDPDQLLIDLRLSEGKFNPRQAVAGNNAIPYDMIFVEWLCTHNPLMREFPPHKPQLPGQKKPSLGSLRYLMDMMYLVTKEFYKDGFFDVPDHFHLAMMYARHFKFYDPVHEAFIRAIMRDLSKYTLSDITWASMTNTIKDKNTRQSCEYQPSEQVFPVSRRMKQYFASREYKKIYKQAYKSRSFYLDYEEMVHKKKGLLAEKELGEL